MGYTVGYEFPSCPSDYPDITELLCLYRKLTSEYTELLNTIKATNDKLDAYMADVESKIPGWIDARVADLRAQIEDILQQMERKLAQAEANIQQFLKEAQETFDQSIKNNNAKVCRALQELYCWVTSQIKVNQSWVEEKLAELKKFHDMDIEELRVSIDAVQKLAVELSEQLLQTMETVKKQFEDAVHAVHVWWYGERVEMKGWVLEQLERMKEIADSIPTDSPVVINPIAGDRFNRLQEFIDDYWTMVAPLHGFTAEEWANQTWVTADVWQEMELNSVEWYCYAKEKYDARYWQWHVFSPVSGEIVTVGKAIQQVFELLNPNGITAGQYDGWNITAGGYDAQNVTGKMYRDGDVTHS